MRVYDEVLLSILNEEGKYEFTLVGPDDGATEGETRIIKGREYRVLGTFYEEREGVPERVVRLQRIAWN